MGLIMHIASTFIVFLSLFLALNQTGETKGVQDAKGYHNNSLLQWDAALQILEKISWKGNERILDVGCGDGKITAFMATHFSEGFVVGLDISESMIQFASSKYGHNEFSNLFFLKGNAAELPFEQQFDVVVSFSTLNWVLDQEKALKAIYKSLIPGGKMYLMVFGKASMNIAKVSEDLIFSEKWNSYFPSYNQARIYFSEDEYRMLLEKVGFNEVEVIAQHTETLYPNKQSLINFLNPLMDFIAHLPQNKQDEFIDDLASKMVSLGRPKSDGSIPFQFVKLQVCATKNSEL